MACSYQSITTIIPRSTNSKNPLIVAWFVYLSKGTFWNSADRSIIQNNDCHLSLLASSIESQETELKMAKV